MEELDFSENQEQVEIPQEIQDLLDEIPEVPKKQPLSPQEMRVLQYILDKGEITYLDAVYDLGVVQLPAIINRLKKKGYEVQTELIKGKNRYDEPVVYAKYKI